MRTSIQRWHRVMSILTCSFYGNLALAEESELEEVIVTGSYLKRSSENSPSPLSVVSAADIADIGAQGVEEIIDVLPWQSGSETRSATFGGTGGVGRKAVNLRNLGMASTLVLTNGKRNLATYYTGAGNAAVDISMVIPSIAIERMEVVKDGASALYGSDAVAGVVNFITKKDFEGFDIQYEFTTDEATRKGDTNNLQLIFGTQGDRGGMVLSAGVFERNPIYVGDRYERFGGSTVSSTGQPGRMFPTAPVVWADNGLFPGQLVGANDEVASNRLPRYADGSAYGNADPSCEASDALDPVGGSKNYFNALCAYDFGPFFQLIGDERSRQMFMTGHYELTDSTEVYFEFGANGNDFYRTNSLNPNALSLIIPVTHFGLLADAATRGIVPQPLRNSTRMIGRTTYASEAERPIDTFSQFQRDLTRMQVGMTMDLDLGGNAWTLDASYTSSEYDTGQVEAQDTQSAQFELAINGFGGPNCDPFTGTAGEGNLAYAASGGNFDAGSCYYFNPFGNSFVNPDGSLQTDLTLVNPPELYKYLQGRVTSMSKYKQRVLDIVAAGDIFETGAGPIGLAVGFQQRKETGRALYDANLNSGNLDFVYGASDWKGALTVNALFAEIAIPLGDSIDLNAAIRREDFDELNTSTTDPKVTILWRPIDALALRASWGSSFRVGSMQQLFGSLTTVHNMGDWDSNSVFKPNLTVGNPNLRPETADMWNVGFSWIPSGMLEGLQFDVDYYEYQYEDILSRESYGALIAADNAALKAAAGCNPCGADDEAAILTAIAAGVGNRDQVVRSDTGRILRVLPDFVNQNAAEISGVDIQASYSFDTSGWGSIRLGMNAAYMSQYDVITASGVIEGVGNYNFGNPVTPGRAIPEWKVNGMLNWSLGSHRAYVAVRYTDGYYFDPAQDAGTRAFWGNTVGLFLGAEAKAKFSDPNIDSMLTVDLNYTYTLPEMGALTSSEITIGARNLLDEEPPWIARNTSYDPVTHDMRGRVWYTKISASL